MKANKHPDYNSQFPELFNWSLLDSRYLSELASDLALQVKRELSFDTDSRINVPGLRFALAHIAGMASI